MSFPVESIQDVFARDTQLMVNYRDPKMVDGKMAYIKQKQFPVEFLAEDAHNWSLLQPVSTIDANIAALIPTKSNIRYSNVNDASKFSVTYGIVYQEPTILGMPVDMPSGALSTMLANALTAPIQISAVTQAAIIQTHLNLLFPGGMSQTKRINFMFQWTPGFGDGLTKFLPSPEREIQKFQDVVLYAWNNGLITANEFNTLTLNFWAFVKYYVETQLSQFIFKQYLV